MAQAKVITTKKVVQVEQDVTEYQLTLSRDEVLWILHLTGKLIPNSAPKKFLDLNGKMYFDISLATGINHTEITDIATFRVTDLTN